MISPSCFDASSTPARPRAAARLRRIAFCIAAGALCLVSPASLRADAEPIDDAGPHQADQADQPETPIAPIVVSPIEQLPTPEPRPMVNVFPDRLSEMFEQLLAQPDAWTRIQVIEAIGSAHAMGLELLDARIDDLAALLRDPKVDRLVRLAAGRALVRMNAIRTAPDFAASIGLDHDLTRLADETLARWNHVPARDIWRDRLADGSQPLLLRQSAADAAATVGDQQAAATALTLAANSATSVSFRLALIDLAKLAPEADRLTRAENLIEGGPVDRLVAARLLHDVEAPAATNLLLRLGRDDNPGVAAEAGASLLDHQPDRLLPLLDRWASAGDVRLRDLAARASAADGRDRAVDRLMTLAADRHPQVRLAARQSLVRIASDRRRDRIIERIPAMLAADQWTSIEQGALLAAELGHHAPAPDLANLLENDQREVRIAAAVALRALADARTDDARLTYVAWAVGEPMRLAQTLGGGRNQAQRDLALPPAYREAVIAVQTLATVSDRRAVDFLLSIIPKARGEDERVRSAALWALSQHFTDQPPTTAVLRAVTRIAGDDDPMVPESVRVRQMAAMSLGLMKAEGALGVLQRYTQPHLMLDELGPYCRWAVGRITGQPQPPLPTGEQMRDQWFVQPLEQ